MIKAVFFDFVGTLLSKEFEDITHQNIIREALRRVKAENVDPLKVWEEYETLTGEKFKEYAGKPYKPIRVLEEEIVEEIAKKHGFEVPHDFWRIHLKMHQEYGKLYDEAVEVLKTLKTNGYHVGMITDSDNDYLNAQLEALGILGFFDSITTSEEAGFYKPHPRMFELALQKANLKGEEAIYVGDNPLKDCVGSRSVDMISVLLDKKGDKKEFWKECEFVISDLREVLVILEELNGQ
ncbi:MULTISPECIES: TIGR02253 family HAD-type hydrolase [Thermococcus]|uniref:Glyceraldehyde 3-phosphate phosphatase n=1 Tax=Thermococcus sibiricus TaxID=172049 RepID=A0A117L2E3_9EURY|nr:MULTISPECIES: TIGR02253 family HAD-type hydrolase [Thermococcus]KUK18698.1 MAG: 2-haloalkanoic acid dehalogenase-like hydrolase [Thermococcus sibiricus]KUK29055.1 MAG: 2-haloalkanoic acid dehalogenase-like hydrolase [Thermococcus sp. 40_45]MBC7094979.1 TIGR02253 family HAD-type hydrolase [Thermococcus sp.]HII68150.1 TIGR02253 family HAD-type hydrolase [Thermococcaceae archaeon]